MPRAVRFEEDHILPSPDTPASPQHALYKGVPKGILLQSGTFEKRASKGGRASRRYSTPVKIPQDMQNLNVEPDYGREQRTARRRSLTAIPNYTPHPSWQAPLPPVEVRTAPTAAERRPPLSPHNPRAFNVESVPARVHPSPKQNTVNEAQLPRYYGTDGSGASGGIPPAYGHVNHGIGAYGGVPQTPSTASTTSHLQARARTPLGLKDVVVDTHLAQPRIHWDIAYPFSTAVFPLRSRLQFSNLDVPATTPALDRLTIKFEHSRLEEACPSFPLSANWGSIKIRGSLPVEHQGKMIGIVTIRDIVNAIYDYFQVPLSAAEFASVSKEFVPLVLEAQSRRLHSNLYQIHGIPLRVDVMGELTRFGGLRITAVKEKRLVFGLDLGPW
ncbi:hypothetical protein CC1G_09866 [Coprinopsis cinerea okayama7|uniref:DUF6699 domain-containing protein n=1 Tax=Coprinopsis cinerea (strain Okayama-7 / 130 / ATCC MYA-4618 / FGSC 9003) TaxID=240176 RepID=A8N8K7_COPC7|nr:hypothetical protein CC1G_09866 [Coprinopsis cinerea okayama7\|eukprot:XP_001831163.1 hypothetical protein CC1G_09866 [Coprinopsis cinerea okayama7\